MLYVCPTPIGNLEDITLRTLRVLQEADYVAAEDTRHTRKLLTHFDIHTPMISLHEHNEQERLGTIIGMLQEGKQIALVSDAGMPGISDPGALLIRAVIDGKLPLTVLPGPSAGVTAFVQSGLLDQHFLFYGFLPRAKKVRIAELNKLQDFPYPIVFYEAPHRLLHTMRDLSRCFGDRHCSVSRELTKRFEETRRGTVSELLEFFEVNPPRGEFVITVSGSDHDSTVNDAVSTMKEDDIRQALVKLIDSGVSRKSAVQDVASRYRLPKNRVYQIALEIKSSH